MVRSDIGSLFPIDSVYVFDTPLAIIYLKLGLQLLKFGISLNDKLLQSEILHLQSPHLVGWFSVLWRLLPRAQINPLGHHGIFVFLNKIKGLNQFDNFEFKLLVGL